ncbi:MAG: MarR family transcriptional regulator [Pelistega sp.]|nr:MarR family transcriptional regulator [Pelistega sp.]
MTFDIEARLNDNSSDTLKLWLRLHACNNQVLNYIRERMRQQFQTTLPRFDLMAQLAGNKNGLKMGELSERLMVSNGNITTITLQLEKEELIERLINYEDRRSTFVRLTSKGTKLYNKMAKAYEQWLMEAFAQISDAQHKRIYKALSDLKEAINSPSTGKY